MATYSTNEFKGGLKLLLDGDPCSIIENEFVKPGKGQAFNRVKLRNLKNGRVMEKTFKSGESVEAADVAEVEMQYLYADDEYLHFMSPDTFEQHAIPADVVGNVKNWLKEQDTCMVVTWNETPLSVTPPNFVNLTVARTDPGVKGDTVSGATKPAVLESGAEIRVPLFINEGDVLRVDTRNGEYVSRAKD